MEGGKVWNSEYGFYARFYSEKFFFLQFLCVFALAGLAACLPTGEVAPVAAVAYTPVSL